MGLATAWGLIAALRLPALGALRAGGAVLLATLIALLTFQLLAHQVAVAKDILVAGRCLQG